jgi:hypothetical protein
MESKQIEDRCQEIETAMNEIVDTVERYFLIAPFQWIEGTNGELHITWFDLVARKKRPKPLIPEAPALSPRFSAIFRPL